MHQLLSSAHCRHRRVVRQRVRANIAPLAGRQPGDCRTSSIISIVPSQKTYSREGSPCNQTSYSVKSKQGLGVTASFSVILSGKIMMKCESIANFMVSTICLGLRLRGGVADAKRGRESDTKEEPIKKRRRVSSSSSEIENMEVDPQPEEEVARAPTAVVRPLSSAAAWSTAPSTPPASELPQALASSTTQKKPGTHKNQHSQGLPQTLGGGPVYGSSTASSSTTNSPRTSARNRFRFSVGSSPHSASTVNVLKPTFRLLRENQCAVLNFAECPTALPQNVRSQRKIGTDPDVPRI